MADTPVFYITTAANHPGGAGYWEIHGCSNETEAREAAFRSLGNKWCFVYDSLDKVHELDRKRHGRIG